MDSFGKSRPISLLTGQQAAATKDQLNQPVQIFHKGVPHPVAFCAHLNDIEKTVKEVTKTFDEEGYYKLKKDTAVPTWIAHQRSFNFPKPALPEDYLALNGRTFKILVPAALRELNEVSERFGKDKTSVTLQTIHQNTDDPQVIELVGVDNEVWNPAILLRCPLKAAWDDVMQLPLFELSGIPQAERWFLDQFLKKVKRGRLHGSPVPYELHLLLEVQQADGQILGNPQPIEEWTIARRNLTGLARPQIRNFTLKERDDLWHPYVSSEPDDTLRLIQMASITNSGGYFFRAASDDFPVPPRDAAQVNLIIAITVDYGQGEGLGDLFPFCNSIVHDDQFAGSQKPVCVDKIKFNGVHHAEVQPYAPPGCVAIGLKREMFWPDQDPDPEKATPVIEAQGFAESVHLVDLEIFDKNGVITHYLPNPQRSAEGSPPKEPWREILHKGDTSAPLFPMGKPIRSETSENGVYKNPEGGVALASLDASTSESNVPEVAAVVGHSHFYRTVVRYAHQDVFSRFSDPDENILKVAPHLRDLHGNRIEPKSNSDRNGRNRPLEFELFYVDPLIPASEWPGVDFGVYCDRQGVVNLQVSYHPPSSPRYYPEDLLEPKRFVAQLSSSGPALDYISRRLQSISRDLQLRAAEMDSEEEYSFVFVAMLNEIVDGPCIYDEDRFTELPSRGEIQALVNLADRRSDRDTARLNRLLLDEAFSAAGSGILTSLKARNVEREVAHARKLQLVLDQLRGSKNRDDVNVVFENEEAGEFELAPIGLDLRNQLISWLSLILSNDNPGNLCLGFRLTHSQERVSRFAPVLRVERTKYLPTDNHLPFEEQDLKVKTLSQIRRSTAAIPFVKAPAAGNCKLAVEQNEFEKIASEFVLAGHQTAMARNRFNEHEIWFVPDSICPSAEVIGNGAANSMDFATARPLSNRLGTDGVAVPDFRMGATGTTGEGWQGFPWKRTEKKQFSGIDFDHCGRAFFGFVESLLTPQNITNPAQRSEWSDLLAAKDGLANALAENLVVSMFEQSAIPNKPGLDRMASDAFKNDLRGFYRIDTFLSLPISKKGGNQAQNESGIARFYGQARDSEIKYRGRSTAATAPRLSDFVFSVQDDWSSGTTSRMTFSYDLPVGQEDKWVNWELTKVVGVISHLQLLENQSVDDGEFRQGRWLELVPANGRSGIRTLEWTPASSVPAILRRYPKEPVLKEVATMKEVFPSLKPAEFDKCQRWGWKISFAADPADDSFAADPADNFGNDTVFLDVHYRNSPREWISDKSALHQPDDPYENLIQALIVGEALAKSYSEIAIDRDSQDHWCKAATKITDFLRSWFASDRIELLDRQPAELVDRFELRLRNAGQPVENISNPVIKKVIFNKETTMPPQFSVEMLPDQKEGYPARLLGKNGAVRRLRPRLFLKRNHSIPEDLGLTNLRTNTQLVYECGPVDWPIDAEVSNVYDTPIHVSGSGDLQDALAAMLGKLVGSSDFEGLAVRIDAKHCFDLSPALGQESQLINPLIIFPTDYQYGSIGEVSRKVVQKYSDWLAADIGGEAGQDVLVGLRDRNPKLRVGLQVSANERVVLQIDDIEFDMNQFVL